jgi:zinc protease
VESLISEEIARLHSDPVTEVELLKARSNARRSAASQRESSLYRAVFLADYAVLYNDPNHINTMLDRQMSVSAADVQRVARTWLKNSSRSVIHSIPASPPQAAVSK